MFITKWSLLFTFVWLFIIRIIFRYWYIIWRLRITKLYEEWYFDPRNWDNTKTPLGSSPNLYVNVYTDNKTLFYKLYVQCICDIYVFGYFHRFVLSLYFEHMLFHLPYQQTRTLLYNEKHVLSVINMLLQLIGLSPLSNRFAITHKAVIGTFISSRREWIRMYSLEVGCSQTR